MIQSSARRVYASVARIAFVFALASATLAQVRGAEPLEPGKTVEVEVRPGQHVEYGFHLEKGQYAKVKLDLPKAAAVVTILRPDRKPLFDLADTPIEDEAFAELVADESGEWALSVGAAKDAQRPARLELTLLEAVEATARHKARALAMEALVRATNVRRNGPRDSIPAAMDLYRKALTHWREAGDLEFEASALYSIAMCASDMADRDTALRYAAEALPAARKSKSGKALAWALETLGYLHNSFGDRRAAIEYEEEALPLMRKAGLRQGEGAVLNDLGIAYNGTGDVRKGLDYFLAAASIFEELQDRRRLSTLHSNIGVTYSNLGDYHKALEHLERSLESNEPSNAGGRATTLNNIGTAHSSLAEYQKALDAHRAALEINRSLGREWNAAVCLHNIAWIHGSLGDRKRAFSLYEEALAILRKIKDRPSMSNTLSNLGEVSFELGNRDRALAYHNEALALRRSVGDRAGEAISLGLIGKVQSASGRPNEAKESLERAVAILRTTENPRRLAGALLTSGAVWRETRDFDKASGALTEALALGRKIQDRRTEADTLAELARTGRDRGNVDEARRYTGEALTALEALRLTIASPSLRAWFFAMKRDVLEMEIDLLMRMHSSHPSGGFAAQAFAAAERSKARSLLELLGESSAEIRRGVDSKLLEREQALQRLIFAKAERQTRLLNGKASADAKAAAAKELTGLSTELQHVESAIRASSPGYAALARPEPLCVDEIQRRVLDRDTVLLEFSLGAGRSYLWALTATSASAYTLPGRQEIETGARRLYELLTARNRTLPNETPAARAARIRQSDAAYLPAAAAMSRMLFGQAAPTIAGKRLLIVADGALQYLPFAALPDPAGNAATPAPLIASHEIVTAPSASVFAAMRETFNGRKHASKPLAVFADPVFSATDGRVVRGSGETRDGGAEPEFLRLRFSRTEAEEIARLAPPGAAWKALDFDASREAALSDDIGQYRIVHFATHAVLDNEHPELSGIVLSRVDRAGQPRNGFLRLYDIYNLRLGSDLVVLSACETALGGEINGEGLIGLTRGFVYAGAPRVVATLWKVDDRPTAEIMKLFYEAMLGRGESPATALRLAQTAMWKKGGWESPYRWAAFTLQGEWR